RLALALAADRGRRLVALHVDGLELVVDLRLGRPRLRDASAVRAPELPLEERVRELVAGLLVAARHLLDDRLDVALVGAATAAACAEGERRERCGEYGGERPGQAREDTGAYSATSSAR